MKFPLQTKFSLSETFIEKYKNTKPNFGFNGLGEFVFLRTYSRIKEDGKNEQWFEVVRRVVEGAFSIQKQHIEDYNLGWNQTKAQKSAQEMYDRIFNFKMLPAGRSLWAMGSDVIMKRGLSEALYNCSFLSTKNITANPGIVFANAMDFLMCGIGVGADVSGADKIKIKSPNSKITEHTISDDREGWVLSLEMLVNSFFGGNELKFDYSLIRKAGEPIKSFGGVSSGFEPLKELHEKVDKILRNNIDNYLSAKNITDIFNLIGKAVVSGNVRRSAEIIIGNPTEEFLDLKDYTKNPDRIDFGWASNNSIFANVGMDYKEIAKRTVQTAEPGYIWMENARKYGRMQETDANFKDHRAEGFNPCITGDTLVAVADGRGKVSIKTLAEENKDIPVYCLSDNNEIMVRTMRQPRLTGEKQPVYEITLENGHTIKTTKSHKFILSNGSQVEAGDLKNGDSLKIFSKVLEQNSKNKFKEQNYYYKLYMQGKQFKEHWMIASYHYNTNIPEGYIVHHIDGNSKNNDPSNLKIVTIGEHNTLHKENSEGDNNGRYSGYTHEEIKEHALLLTKKLGRRFSRREWIKYAKPLELPIQFSKWRKDTLESIIALSKWAALELNFENINSDPRTVRLYMQLLSEGYNCYIDDNDKIVFIKKCEVCGNEFETNQRHTVFCSSTCVNINIWNKNREKITNNQKEYFDNKRKELQEKQINIFNKLKLKINKIPSKKEWVEFCKQNNISFEISRESSPFRNYQSLIQAAELYNHKVISVKFSGYEDVYNGTVDEFHNYAIGGFNEKTNIGKFDKEVFVFTINCSEINLENGELCNLVELFPTKHENLDDFKTTIKYAYLYAKTITLLNTHWQDTNRVMLRNRRIGLSITGITQFISEHGINTMKEWMEEGYTTAKRYDKVYSEWFAIPESIKISTVKPSGSISLLAGVTPGIHFPQSQYYIRRVRLAKNSPFISVLQQSGYNVEPAFGQEDSTVVTEFPIGLGDNIRTQKDVSMWEQLNLTAFAQKYWSDNGVSVTVTFRKDEEKDIEPALNLFQFSLKSVSFLPYTEEGVYKQMPYEEITKEKYEEMASKLKPLNFTDMFSQEATGEKYCNNDGCSI